MNNLQIQTQSALLFATVKKICIELIPNINPLISSKVIYLLSQLDTQLSIHSKKSQPFFIPENFADYIFAPISLLLKNHQELDDLIVASILKIIAFLWQHSWKYNGGNHNAEFLDQCYALILYLTKSKEKNITSNTRNLTISNTQNIDFKTASISAISSILNALPLEYFKKPTRKRLSFLGDTITFLLSILDLCNGSSLQEFEMVQDTLNQLLLLSQTLMTSDQVAQVLPGIVSLLTNFVVVKNRTCKPITFSTLLMVLRECICRSFNDEDFKEEENQKRRKNPYTDLQSLYRDIKKEEGKDDNRDEGKDDKGVQEAKDKRGDEKINNEGGDEKEDHRRGESSSFRTFSWSRATSQQLQLSLFKLFKSALQSPLLLLKIASNVSLQQDILLFFKRILRKCFFTLADELVPLSIDVFALLIALVASEHSESLASILMEDVSDTLSCNYNSLTHNNETKTVLLSNIIKMKLSNLIEEKFKQMIYTTEEYKLKVFFASVTLQFKVYHAIEPADFVRLRSQFLCVFVNHVSDLFRFHSKKKSGDSFNSDVTILGTNTLDNIILPTHINAKNVAKTNTKSATKYHASSLILLTRELAQDLKLSNKLAQDSTKADALAQDSTPTNELVQNSTTNELAQNSATYELAQNSTPTNELCIFTNIFSSSIERILRNTIKILSQLKVNGSDDLNDFETILNLDSDIYSRSVSLWLANWYLQQYQHSTFDPNIYLSFDVREDDDPTKMEIIYLLSSKALSLLEESKFPQESKLSESKSLHSTYDASNLAYALAISTAGNISNCIDLIQFKQDFMMDFLYPILEALTYDLIVRSLARSSIQKIIDNYYSGSIELLIVQNLEYLIDKISLCLLIPSSFSQSIPGILLILIKLAGVQLLKNNQVNDVISNMFVVIDSFHGYTNLVESFFIVFNELLTQIDMAFLSSSSSSSSKMIMPLKNDSHPWGMSNISQVLKLLDDSQELICPPDNFDPQKDYFIRKPNTLFGDQVSDSDDEEEEEEDEGENVSNDETWACIVPQQSYMLAQQIFNYGFLMLTSLSNSLKVQALLTLRQCLSILCMNYKLVPVTLAQNWPILLSLMSGRHVHSDTVIQAALRFAIDIINQDSGEQFMSRRFIELCEYLLQSQPCFSKSIKSRPSYGKSPQPSYNQSLQQKHSNPQTNTLYVTYFLTGLKVYLRAVPDVLKYTTFDACMRTGIPSEIDLTRDLKNIRFVISRNKSAQ